MKTSKLCCILRIFKWAAAGILFLLIGTLPRNFPSWPFASLPLIGFGISFVIRGIVVLDRRWWVPVIFYGCYLVSYLLMQGAAYTWIYSGPHTPDLFFYVIKDFTGLFLGPVVCLFLLLDTNLTYRLSQHDKATGEQAIESE